MVWEERAAGQLTDVVFAVLWLAQLVNEELNGFGRRSHKAQAAQMAHLLACLAVEATWWWLAGQGGEVVVDVLGQVDFMAQQGGLSGGGGDDGNLW